MSAQPAKAVDQPTAAAAPPKQVDEDPTVGRIQVSAQRRRRFYVFVARRQFASKPECKQVVITALGSAIAAAISTAGELEDSKVGKIIHVETCYSPINPGVHRNVSRIAITIERNPEWKPDESDAQRPARQRKEPAAASAEEKKSEAPAPAAVSTAPTESGPKAQ
eukprot:Gregarina_sp_Poly_1__8401@NODE_493_length_7956_cov_236_715173_g397_i0_p7_GENE_NODE_493_length_7956_cov_236_715173_g397_i0NODE_493_length_7956_cov_236_715173_g397_i0_p7_ORF_typecomplete_len165_score28_24Alba/PF01918_21/1_8e06Rpp20/PF12328_8/0_014Rpp20/PF12328_8/4_5e03_NODE_493_length_7956_cov_236_715173_g397_i044894983